MNFEPQINNRPSAEGRQYSPYSVEKYQKNHIKNITTSMMGKSQIQIDNFQIFGKRNF